MKKDKNKAGHKSHIFRKRLKRLICTIAVIMSICVCFTAFLSYAKEKTPQSISDHTYYKSIRIQPGDTLWNIAEKYMPESCDSINDYIETLKEINNLKSDQIISGHNLIIVYTKDIQN